MPENARESLSFFILSMLYLKISFKFKKTKIKINNNLNKFKKQITILSFVCAILFKNYIKSTFK